MAAQAPVVLPEGGGAAADDEGQGGDGDDEGAAVDGEDTVSGLLGQILGQNPELRSTLNLMER